MSLKAILLTVFSVASHAALLQYTPTEQTGAQTVNLVVTFDDTAVPGGILGTVAVTPNGDPDIGDIRAVFFDLINLVGVTEAQIAASISGPLVTDVETNTTGSGFGGGANIMPLGPFDIGIELGTAGMSADDIQFTTFLIDNPLLTLANFGAVGVRVQSIGVGNDRGGSGKFLDDTGTLLPGGGDVVIPEPSTYALVASAIVALLVKRSARF